MSKSIVDDKLWQVVEPLLPKVKRRRRVHPGRKPIGHRQALTGVAAERILTTWSIFSRRHKN